MADLCFTLQHQRCPPGGHVKPRLVAPAVRPQPVPLLLLRLPRQRQTPSRDPTRSVRYRQLQIREHPILVVALYEIIALLQPLPIDPVDGLVRPPRIILIDLLMRQRQPRPLGQPIVPAQVKIDFVVA